MESSESDGAGRAWSWTDLTKPAPAAATLTAFLVSAFSSQVFACNIHEIGHAAIAVPLDWEVERIRWCAPGGGGVDYSHVGTWAGNLQGYAGGMIAGLVLFLAYLLLFAYRSRPHRSPWMWAGGLGIVVWIGPQLVIAGMEGSAGPNEDYTELFATRGAIFVPLLLLAAAVGVASYSWRWRGESDGHGG